MVFDDEQIHVGHAEACQWADWFLLEQTRKGMPKDQKDQMGAVIYAFLASGPVFIKSLSVEAIPCPKCQGRGHTNLYLAGSDKPSSCSNCNGSGKIEPSKPVGMDAGE